MNSLHYNEVFFLQAAKINSDPLMQEIMQFGRMLGLGNHQEIGELDQKMS